MTKRKPASRSARKSAIDPERSPYFSVIAFALVLLSLVILFSDFLFSDQMLYGSDTIQAGVFFRTFLYDYVHERGTIPEWNPYIFGGLPYVEAFHGDIFYPLSKLLLFGPVHRMLGFILFLHFCLAFVFMYLSARQLKLPRVAASISGIIYSLAPFLISLTAPGHDGKIYVTTLFPLVILFIDRAFERRPFLNFTMLGVVLGLIIISPHVQMAYFTMWAAALFTLYKLIRLYREKGSFSSLVKPAILAWYAVAISVLLSAIQFYPGYTYTTTFSPRAADDSKSGWNWATSWSIHEEEAMSLLIPEFAGVNSRDAETLYWGKNPFKDNSESVSVVALFIGILGLIYSRRKVRWFFGGLALFAFLYALGGNTFFFRLFYLIPMVSSLRAPSMIMFLFAFSMALLTGLGIQAIREQSAGESKKKAPDRREQWFNFVLIGFPVALLVLAFAFSAAGESMLRTWCSVFYSDAFTPNQQGVNRLAYGMQNLSAIQGGAWMSFLVVTASAALVWLYRNKKIAGWALVLIGVIVLFNGVRFNGRFVHTFDSASHFHKTPLAGFLDNQPGHFRVMELAQPNNDMLPHFGHSVPYGYHGNQLRWYDELAGGPGMTSRFNPRFLNLVGTKWMVLPANQMIPDGYFGQRPAPVVNSFGQTALVRNDNAFPRVFLGDQYRVFPGYSEAVDQVLNGTDTLGQLIYLEQEPSLTIQPDTTPGDSAWIEDYGHEVVTVGVETDQNSLLVFTDTWFDAWKAEVDGSPAEVLRAFGAFRAVAVPAGSGEVRFYYESHRYATGKWITGLTVLYVFGALAGAIVLGRRKESNVETNES